MKTEKCLADLQLEVIYNDKCVQCGSCGAFCQNIFYEGGKLNFKEQCSETVGVCYNFCPRSELNLPDLDMKMFGKKRDDQALGVYLKAAKASLANADLGDVTAALLVSALEAGSIDSVVLGNANVEKALEPVICKSKDEIVANAGERKGLGPIVQGAGKAIKDGLDKIAVVGRPCHAQGLAKIKTSTDFKVNQDKIALVIAQFCLAQGKGCPVCLDYSGEFADISLDAKTGEMLIRTDFGQGIVDKAIEAGYIEIEDADVSGMQDKASNKKITNYKKILAKSNDVVTADYVKLDTDGLKKVLAETKKPKAAK
ncbi:MAG TPA: Coenzyme F420 hydrogenase/dehydrogenase, beta subunit C-terminal domain [Candidatus Lokiarchaeia archaeon]|nr:Coenzyme F420 hydrogenase/dehydrogenase, beta subunit C-terminal domain [Candidatus Lokiarchaeia archaeon]